MTKFAEDADDSTGLFGEAVNHRQAQACALVAGLCGKEGLKYSLEDFLRHALPCVRDAHTSVRALSQFARFYLRISFVEIPQLRRYDDGAAVRHCIPSVHYQIEQRAFQPRRIDEE